MSHFVESRLPLSGIKSIIFDHERDEVILTATPDEVPELQRFISVDSWWETKKMSLLINSSINTWLNQRGWRDANEEGLNLNVTVTTASDEARYSTEIEDSLKSAKGSHLGTNQIMFKVIQEARRIALDKRTRVSYVGEYLVDFADTLGDVYRLSQKKREELKRLATYSKSSRS